MQRPLLEWVFSKTAGMSPELEEIWMEWYDYHQLMMCRMPGWTWNYRLMNLIGPEKYVSLYRVEDYEALKLIEGWPRVDQGKMDPITDNIDPAALQDWEDKVRRGLQDTGKFTFTGGATDQEPAGPRTLGLAVPRRRGPGRSAAGVEQIPSARS